jgi:hypothetical protein
MWEDREKQWIPNRGIEDSFRMTDVGMAEFREPREMRTFSEGYRKIKYESEGLVSYINPGYSSCCE